MKKLLASIILGLGLLSGGSAALAQAPATAEASATAPAATAWLIALMEAQLRRAGIVVLTSHQSVAGSSAIFQVTVSLSGRRPAKRSAISIQTPPMTSAQATGVTVSGSSQPARRTGRPTTAVTRKATPSFIT